MIPIGPFQLKIFCGSLFKLKIVPKLHLLWFAEGMSYKINAKILLHQTVCVCSVNLSLLKSYGKRGEHGQLVLKGFSSVQKWVCE